MNNWPAIITIVWRPNVGKSSIFNVISWHKIAIVSDIENTTRDILEYHIHDDTKNISYILRDSWGLAFWTHNEILVDVRDRVAHSIEQSEIVLFVLEYDKITAHDEEIAKILRKWGKHVIVIANKADNTDRARESHGLMRLWFWDVYPVSSLHNRGFWEVLSSIASRLQAKGYDYHEETYDENTLKIAIIWRPNVGKSSLINALTWENRAMVLDMPWTTRDTIDSLVYYEWNPIVLIDTAWIRRSGKIGARNIEDWSVMRSERAIERADIAVVVIDANEGITWQDQAIVWKALELSKGILLVCNKWDKVQSRWDLEKIPTKEEYEKYLKKRFEFIDYVATIFTSAIDGKWIDTILSASLAIQEERKKRVKTGVFNNFLEQIAHKHPPRGNRKSHKPKMYYGSQVDTNPPKFLISVNNENHFHFSYPRYIENQIREHFWFAGTPILIELKGRESIYKQTQTKSPEDLKASAAKYHEKQSLSRSKTFSRWMRKKKH